MWQTRATQESKGEIFGVSSNLTRTWTFSTETEQPDSKSQRLRQQCENLELPLIAPPPINKSSFPMAPDAQTNAFRRALNNADLVVDCIFGQHRLYIISL